MKKVTVIFCIAFVIITACLIYLVRHGISLRSAPLIKPTLISEDGKNIADHTVLRLFPEFQSAKYLVLGILPTNAESVQLLENLRIDYESRFHRKVSWIQNGQLASGPELLQCEAPCWILLPREAANELAPLNWVTERLRPLLQPYFTLSVIDYVRDEPVPEACESEKRQTLKCLESVSVREVHKKLKLQNQRYFFMRKYNDTDYFLFIEKEIPKSAVQ